MSLDSPLSSTGQVPGQRETRTGAEWNARPLRPVAHWVVMPDETGRDRLTCVWTVPDPLPPA